MPQVSLDFLQDIARRVIDSQNVTLTADGKAQDVLGWDSLNHTLIILEVNSELGIDLSPYDAAAAPTFGALVEMIQKEVDARQAY